MTQKWMWKEIRMRWNNKMMKKRSMKMGMRIMRKMVSLRTMNRSKKNKMNYKRKYKKNC